MNDKLDQVSYDPDHALPSPLTKEEEDALVTLSRNQRLMVLLVPNDVPDRFVAQLTTWTNFILDTKILLPIPLPVTKKGDGLVCPYCHSIASQNVDVHAVTCDWRQAVIRWANAQMQIDKDFPEGATRG